MSLPNLAVGIDAYPDGWVAIALDARRQFYDGFIASHLGDLVGTLLEQAGEVTVCIDIPIGPGGPDRIAEKFARKMVDNKSTVFSVPHECVWNHPDHASANAAHKLAYGKGLTQQTWGLKKKIAETALVVDSLPDHVRMFEGHPEVSFAAMKREGHSGLLPKVTRGGRLQRERLLAHRGIVLPREGAGQYDRVPDNDINDACALAWSAQRILAGTAVALPALPEGVMPGRVSSDTIWY
jgi:predicted RNase H-like nuclease